MDDLQITARRGRGRCELLSIWDFMERVRGPGKSGAPQSCRSHRCCWLAEQAAGRKQGVTAALGHSGKALNTASTAYMGRAYLRSVEESGGKGTVGRGQSHVGENLCVLSGGVPRSHMSGL